MNHKSRFLLITLFLIIFFIIFIVQSENRIKIEKQNEIDLTSEIVAESVWSLYGEASTRYLEYTFYVQKYKSLKITTLDNIVFVDLNYELDNPIDVLLSRLTLIKTYKVSSDINYNSRKIGVVEAEIYNFNIYTYLYLVLVLFMLWIISWFFIRFFKEKVDLKELIEEKTIEIRTQNMNLERIVAERTEIIKKNQEKLVESEKLAALGNLVSGVAHEINTPIGISVTSSSYISKLIHDLREKLSGTNKISKKEIFDTINDIEEISDLNLNNLSRASQMVENFKKLSADQSLELTEEINLKEYLEMLIQNLKHELKKSNTIINVECNDDVVLIANPGNLFQIFTNLIMNSIKHGFIEKYSGKIDIRISKKGKKIHIEFIDNGVGIPYETRKKVFEPFYTTNRSGGGTGLGLYIVSSIITNKFEGSIEIVDTIEGAHFLIILNSYIETLV